MSLVICFAFAVVSLDPPISFTYTCDNFARVLMGLVAMSGAGLSPKFNLSNLYTVGESVVLFHRNL